MLTGRAKSFLLAVICFSLVALSEATPHGDEHVSSASASATSMSKPMAAHGGHAHGTPSNASLNIAWSESFSVPNYFRHPEHGFWIQAHIGLMVVAWAFTLPSGVMLSIARSRFTLLVQLSFFALNALGMAAGIVYNANTPDLYENNAHHKMGWIYTCMATVWIVFGVVNTYASSAAKGADSDFTNDYAPVAQHSRNSSIFRRWSDDSGHGTERTSSICSAHSPTSDDECGPAYDGDYLPMSHEESDNEKPHLLHGTRLDGLLSRFIRGSAGSTLRALWLIHVIIERSLIVLGFTAFCTGFVTWGGIFRGSEVFTGLAHFIKGGIFFWIGILAIARWAGAFADLGWAWNVKPAAAKRTVSMEMVESGLICVYGASNVWLEHLAAWGEEWSAMDYEHVSITILFFGGGLLGMLVESKRIRRLLNNSLLAAHTASRHSAEMEEQEKARWSSPDTASTPLNPMPALTILLLGIIMAAHTQHSVFAATIHTMWGALFTLAAVFRLSTYLLNYIKPPTSYLPSRPPTELIAGFALVAGGFMFMISPRDIVDAMVGGGADAMVAFVVSMGFTAVVCALVVACMAVKGWAVGREQRPKYATASTNV